MKSWKSRIFDSLKELDPVHKDDKIFASNDLKTFIYKVQSKDINDEFFLKTGFRNPTLIPDGYIQLTLDKNEYSPDKFADLLGRDKTILVIDVDKQQNVQWTFDQWCQYFNLPEEERKKIYNVISVEFSKTKLESWLKIPDSIKRLDWFQYWPQHLIKYDPESLIIKSNYPKVQHYCLMGVKDSYTDFHIDFGGTSVWYHIIHGKKIFILIPPTEENLEKYEQWNKNPKQSSIYFADLIDKNECIKCELEAGNSLLIPTGWIHAVYTPEDSVVFGGNFLHSLNSKLQIKVTEIEERCKVGPEFMFPYFPEMNWLVADHYARMFIEKSQSKDDLISDWERESLIYINDYISKNKKYFPLYLIEKYGEWWAPYIIDVIASYLQSLEIPQRNLYEKLSIYGVSPLPHIQNCFCLNKNEGDKSHLDSTYIGCDYCGGWFHSSCLNIESDEIENIESFYCPKCEEKLKNSKRKNSTTPFDFDQFYQNKKMKIK